MVSASRIPINRGFLRPWGFNGRLQQQASLFATRRGPGQQQALPLAIMRDSGPASQEKDYSPFNYRKGFELRDTREEGEKRMKKGCCECEYSNSMKTWKSGRLICSQETSNAFSLTKINIYRWAGCWHAKDWGLWRREERGECTERRAERCIISFMGQTNLRSQTLSR